MISWIRNHRASLNKISLAFNLLTLLYFVLGAFQRTETHEENEENISLLSERNLNAIRLNPTLAPTKTLNISESFLSFSEYPCTSSDYRVELRGNYWVLYNYIKGEKTFGCHESITYTTHGDVSFLDNLEPLLERWQGPLSLALYAPGSDFEVSLQTIFAIRECSKTIRRLVTFHLFFDAIHMPSKKIIHPLSSKETEFKDYDCSRLIFPPKSNYKEKAQLDYPVNVARNIARLSATTKYIFPSDIELYPSPGLIDNFLAMIRANVSSLLHRPNRKVFVNSIFEIDKNSKLPSSKSELLDLLKNETVIPFHHKLCSTCHTLPHAKEWIENPIKDGMDVSFVGKRHPPYQHWEPIYISSNDEPLYDERLTWEGRADKMTQGYQMCILDYDFLILDNAFLIHRPGIKTLLQNTKSSIKDKISAQNKLIKDRIINELKTLFGAKKGCEI